MGCISSKGMGRSMSIQERFNQGFHALTIGEDFHMTSRERDRIITLIKSASGKNLMGFRYVGDDIDESIKTCTSVEEQDEKGRKSQASESAELPEISKLGQNVANETNWIDPGSANARCRTFHTLEEFEEMIQKVKLFESRIVEDANGRVESEVVASSTSDSLETCRLFEDKDILSNNGRLSQSQDKIPDDVSIVTTPKSVDATSGWKRKAMARQIESLILPISAKSELSSVGSLKQWIHAGGDIYSPETYVTPKFGSYATDRGEFGMFSPELVAVFEECMQQMEAEEVAIVKQMEESLSC